MKKIKYITFLIVGLLVTASCTKDWLEVKPYGKIEPSTYYSTDQEIQNGVIAIYDMLSSADQLNGWSSNFVMRNLPGDDLNAGGGGASDQAQYQAIDDFDWTPSNPGISSFWSVDYNGIYRANQIIDNVKTTTAIANRSIAEAKFFRAYFYLELVTCFGDVPLYTTAAKGLTDFAARSPKADVYAQIEKDLTDAIAGLPNKNDYASTDRFRASKQAAQGLLVRANLYQEKWSAAITAFEALEAVEGAQVGLYSNFEDITKKVTEFGIESLLEGNFIGEDKNWGTVAWNRNANDNRHIQLCGPRSSIGGSLGINGGWGFMPPTAKLYNLIPDADPRKIYTVLDSTDMVGFAITEVSNLEFKAGCSSNGNVAITLAGTTFNIPLTTAASTPELVAAAIYAAKATFTGYTVADPKDGAKVAFTCNYTGTHSAYSAGSTGAIGVMTTNPDCSFTDGWDTEKVIRRKYTTFASETNGTGGNTPELNFATNWRLITYREVLLNAAEAYYRAGDEGNARDQVNKLRNRVGYTTTVATGAALLAEIKGERLVELAYEGFRFWDLVRWGDASTQLSTLGFVAGKHELFPIPEQEVNGGLAAQNPGY